MNNFFFSKYLNPNFESYNILLIKIGQLHIFHSIITSYVASLFHRG